MTEVLPDFHYLEREGAPDIPCGRWCGNCKFYHGEGYGICSDDISVLARHGGVPTDYDDIAEMMMICLHNEYDTCSNFEPYDDRL